MDSIKVSKIKSILLWTLWGSHPGACSICWYRCPFVFMIMNSFKGTVRDAGKRDFRIAGSPVSGEIVRRCFRGIFSGILATACLYWICVAGFTAVHHGLRFLSLSQVQIEDLQPPVRTDLARMSIPIHITLIPVFR